RVWTQVRFEAITTAKIRIYVTGALNSYSRITEVEAYASAFVSRVNHAASVNGGAALASSSYNVDFAPAGAIDGDRKGVGWGHGGGWNDATPDLFPDFLQIDFDGVQSITEIDVFTVQDNYQTPGDPTPAMSFSLYGVTDFEVQYRD